jgi:hypothetical protein
MYYQNIGNRKFGQRFVSPPNFDRNGLFNQPAKPTRHKKKYSFMEMFGFGFIFIAKAAVVQAILHPKIQEGTGKSQIQMICLTIRSSEFSEYIIISVITNIG